MLLLRAKVLHTERMRCLPCSVQSHLLSVHVSM